MGNHNPRGAIYSITTVIFYKKSLLQLLLFVTVLNCSVVSFNVEERYPIVKTGPTGSLFGLSVAQHHIVESSNAKDNAILLVGAPTDDPASGAVAPGPGALYKCSVLNDANCTNVPITPKEVPEAEDISKQWLGVTVKSYRPGGRIVTCAHRYTLLGREWEAPLGRCFILKADLTPIDDRNEFEYVPCENKQDTTNTYSHENFGYCQAGVSAHFAADVSGQANMKPYLVVGTPGSVHWGGSLSAKRQIGDFGLTIEDLWSKPNTVSTNFQMGNEPMTLLSQLSDNCGNYPYNLVLSYRSGLRLEIFLWQISFYCFPLALQFELLIMLFALYYVVTVVA